MDLGAGEAAEQSWRDGSKSPRGAAIATGTFAKPQITVKERERMVRRLSPR